MTKLDVDDILLKSEPSEFTDEDICYFRDNPKMLDLISDRETLSLKRLWQTLLIAIVMVGFSKVIAITTEDTVDQFFLNVASDLVFEMGAALIGAIATVIFIRHQQIRQFKENLHLRSEIERRIEYLKND